MLFAASSVIGFAQQGPFVPFRIAARDLSIATKSDPGFFTIGGNTPLTRVPADSLAVIEFVTFDCQAAPPLAIVSAHVVVSTPTSKSPSTEYTLTINRQGTLVTGFVEKYSVSQTVRIYADAGSDVYATFIASAGANSEAKTASCNITITGWLLKNN